ncbi:hypothetical protein B0H15DRAFT_433645 [Mycena belliarum]|uniref:Uncharacterized protein n=1 Tax=Mycena belliarum TaxID=1033014 RepID=A0AAD6U1Q1_9AGAR|nr:hypothetical protein B0H15DRAFT_433645 [Mycena belliae]
MLEDDLEELWGTLEGWRTTCISWCVLSPVALRISSPSPPCSFPSLPFQQQWTRAPNREPNFICLAWLVSVGGSSELVSLRPLAAFPPWRPSYSMGGVPESSLVKHIALVSGIFVLEPFPESRVTYHDLGPSAWNIISRLGSTGTFTRVNVFLPGVYSTFAQVSLASVGEGWCPKSANSHYQFATH